MNQRNANLTLLDRKDPFLHNISYRQWMIGQAMQGLIISGVSNTKILPQMAIACADAVIEAEQKKQLTDKPHPELPKFATANGGKHE